MTIPVQFGLYIFVIIAVLFYMWQMKGDCKKHYPWAPALGITSVWSGLCALLGTVMLWFFPVFFNDWLITSLLFLTPFSATAGVLVLWLYRHEPREGLEETIFFQLSQAKVGIFFSLIAIVLGYWFVLAM